MGNPKLKKTSFDYFIYAFYQTARAIVRLSSSDALTIEMRVGDFQSVLDNVRDNKEERKARGMAVEYDSIDLSNVPDYTGFLNEFSESIEMLKPVKHSYIGFSVFLNVVVWKSLNDVIHSYLLVPGENALPRYLGVKSVGEDDLWEGFRFSRIEGPIPLDQLLGRDELIAWLSRLFVTIVTPSAVEPGTFPIHSPNNITMFFKLLGRLLRIGYPTHWITGVVELLLSGSLTTVEPTRKNRMIPLSRVAPPLLKMLSITPWLIEIRTQAALWMDKYQIRLLAGSIIPSVSDIKRYDISIRGTRSYSGPPFSSVIMMAIEYPSNQIFSPSNGADDNLRFQLLDATRNKTTIITTILFDGKTVSFWMSETDYNNLLSQNVTIKLFRNDTWKPFTEPKSLQ
ncbi:hypothetical protein DFA_07156 [Cavenderia fasciculata]|uniref:Uncharacterized protein n=1 Tax=Cavenderia fasciculata TaxID=261658 RepID=F4PVM6_CACFS|nr:uncharacterized protein DFA_07156 [Cavenderia fasciculata]EGG20040.1 hypothetical protein DFA_07156 [Cavenderia fasciculata]|eukprot:XP_004367023.1 hypothetical protein DFA_07156 [Cavenderia fasciculata]